MTAARLPARCATAFEPMPAEARSRVRARLDAAVAADRAPFLVRFARPLVALAVGASMLGGVSAAAAVSGPGDTLYPLKRSLSVLATSLEPQAARSTLTPLAKPASTPAAAAKGARGVAPAASGSGSGAKALTGNGGSNGSGVLKDKKAGPKSGGSPSKGGKRTAPSKGKSSGRQKSESTSSGFRNAHAATRSNGRGR